MTAVKNVGTRYPFISLEKAIGRAQELFDADQKGREMTIAAAFGLWGYSDKSSGGFQTVAALKMYALVKDSSGGDSRKIGLSDSALWYFRDEREDEKKKLLCEFALAPKLIAALWAEWQSSPPADPVARSHLKAERGLNDQAARTLLSIYKENIAFAELKAGDKVALIGSEHEEPDMDAQSSTLPVETNAAGMKAYTDYRRVVSPIPQPGMLQEVFALEEGAVTVTFPAELSATSYQDLADHLEIFLRKAKRKADRARQENGPDE